MLMVTDRYDFQFPAPQKMPRIKCRKGETCSVTRNYIISYIYIIIYMLSYVYHCLSYVDRICSYYHQSIPIQPAFSMLQSPSPLLYHGQKNCPATCRKRRNSTVPAEVKNTAGSAATIPDWKQG